MTIEVSLMGEDDPREAIESMVQLIKIGLHSGGLGVRGIAPDGKVYLWFPEHGKTPDEWLVQIEPQEVPMERHVSVPPGMTTDAARRVLVQAAFKQFPTDDDE